MEKEYNPELIRIYEDTTLWHFFLFTLTAFDILIFDKKLHKIFPRTYFKTDKDFEDFTELQSRLNSLTDSMLLVKFDDKQKSFSELSLNDILYFLILIDSVAKYLLSLDNISSDLIEEVSVVTGISSNWEKSFFTEAQFIFDEMKDSFKSFPEIIDAVINMEGQQSRI